MIVPFFACIFFFIHYITVSPAQGTVHDSEYESKIQQSEMAMLLTLSEVSDVWHKNILKVAFNLLFTAFILDLNSVFQHCAHFTFALFKEEGTGVLFQSNYLNSHFFAAGHCYCMIFRQSFCSQKSTQRVNSTLAEPN